jgi:hypothetical protein
LPLPLQILRKLLRAMPLVAVALDGQSALPVLDDEVDTIAGECELRNDTVARIMDFEPDISLKPAIERTRWGLTGRSPESQMTQPMGIKVADPLRGRPSVAAELHERPAQILGVSQVIQ